MSQAQWTQSPVGSLHALGTHTTLGFPCGSADKDSTCNEGDLGSIPGLGRSPGEGKGYPFPYSDLETLMDYSPWGHKQSDSTERFLSLFIHEIIAELTVYANRKIKSRAACVPSM